MNESINKIQTKQELDDIKSHIEQTNHNIEDKQEVTTIKTSKSILSLIPRIYSSIDKEFNLNLCWHCQVFAIIGPILPYCQLCYFIHSYLVGHNDIRYDSQVSLVKAIRLDRFILLDQYGLDYFKAEYLKQHNDYLTLLLNDRFNKNKKSNNNNPANQTSILDKSNIHAANQWHNDRQDKYKAQFDKATNY